MLWGSINWEMDFLRKVREGALMTRGQSSGHGTSVPKAFLLRKAATCSAAMAARESYVLGYCTPLMKDIISMRHVEFALVLHGMYIFRRLVNFCNQDIMYVLVCNHSNHCYNFDC